MAAKITWSILTPAGTTSFDSPELDVIASGASQEHYKRFVDWIWYRFPVLDGNGDPLPRTPAREAQAFQSWGQEQWEIAKTNVLTWEQSERYQAVQDGPDFS